MRVTNDIIETIEPGEQIMTRQLSEVMANVAAKVKARRPRQAAVIPETLPVEGRNRPMRDGNSQIVTISNALARAAQGLTLNEKRVVTCCIAQINSKEAYDPTNYLASSLSAKKYAEQFDLDIDIAYKELKQAGDKLLSRTVSFFEMGHTAKGQKRPELVRSNWVQHVRYVEQKGYIEILWTHKVGAELKGLTERFTTYKLKYASALRSVYSWRLLEYFESHSDTGWAEPTVEEFATMMEATEKQRKNFARIRTRIIEPAVKDLVEKDGWLIEWRPLKYGGRKISGIRFEFKRDPQGRLF